MPNYIFSPLAQADMDEIWDYTAKNWDIKQAEAYTRELKEAVESLAANPKWGRSCENVRLGYYKYPVGSHVLFFCLLDKGIDVKRILHERMDFDRHL